MADDTSMNYEKLFDCLREERNNVKLQELPVTFYSSIIEYFKIKGGSSSDQLRNAKRIVEEIYDRREKKILNLALNKSRTKSNLIDISALLPEETVFFKQAVVLIDHFREDILKRILLENATVSSSLEEEAANVALESSFDEVKSQTSKAMIVESGNVRVKFLKYVDKFVGSNLEIFGPFDEGNVAELPLETANLVISKGFAQKFGE